jgi:hypothetical protein
MLDWPSRSWALDNTLPAAVPIASAAALAPPILALTSLEPAATDWMLRAISWVAVPCSSTAAEILVVIWLVGAIGARDGADRVHGLVGGRLHC